MIEKLNISISKLGDLIPEYFPVYKKEGDVIYPMKIHAEGISEEDVKLDVEEGIIIVDGGHDILIEEDERYCPWNRYATYGFYRSYILPEGIQVKDVHVKVEGGYLYLGWVN